MLSSSPVTDGNVITGAGAFSARAAVEGKAEVLSAVLWLCSLADPYDQAVIAADEVKEEEPEPFQKIGPSKSYYGFK